jgi:hypothetical protein
MNEGGLSIGIFPEVLPSSNTSEQRWCDETIDRDPVLAEIQMMPVVEFRRRRAKDFPPVEGEHSRLVPLLSSIGG